MFSSFTCFKKCLIDVNFDFIFKGLFQFFFPQIPFFSNDFKFVAKFEKIPVKKSFEAKWFAVIIFNQKQQTGIYKLFKIQTNLVRLSRLKV